MWEVRRRETSAKVKRGRQEGDGKNNVTTISDIFWHVTTISDSFATCLSLRSRDRIRHRIRHKSVIKCHDNFRHLCDHLRQFPTEFWPSPFDLRRKKTCFFGGFSLLLIEKQGKEEQGFVPTATSDEGLLSRGTFPFLDEVFQRKYRRREENKGKNPQWIRVACYHRTISDQTLFLKENLQCFWFESFAGISLKKETSFPNS